MAVANAAVDGLILEEALELLRIAPHAVAVLDAEGRFAWANEACARLFSWSGGSDLVGCSCRETHDVEEADRLEREAFAPAREGAPWRGEATARRHDGVHVPLDMILTPRYRHRLAVIFLDLDRFKQVNTTVGHAAGDALLKAASERRGSRGLRVMVNLSAHELQQAKFVVHVEKALAASGLEPDVLHLEVPEGYAMQDLDRALETLRALRTVGVRLSIDGFGAGFSSLAHLRPLPVDALRIDLSFVRVATTDPDDASIVTAVIAVAHSPGLRVVAVAVETDPQVALLRSLGCDEVQGYLWSPPVPPREVRADAAEGALPAPSFPPRGRHGRSGHARSRRRRSGR